MTEHTVHTEQRSNGGRTESTLPPTDKAYSVILRFSVTPC